MREYVELFRKLTAGERLKHLVVLARPINDLEISVFTGALGDKSLELAGEIANGVVLNFPTVSTAQKSILETIKLFANWIFSVQCKSPKHLLEKQMPTLILGNM
jgi:alkanesulfonate monooxygenase SsuD/methylene tetrahydromethanopterin reductase-like flavin-dependent oxidoreductase (luciferase family)